MELNSESKAKFFAQYMHQVVFGFGCPAQNGDTDDGSLYVLNGTTLEQDIETSYINLKPLSSITDEDSIKVREIMHWPNKGIKSVSQTIVLLNMNMFPMILTDYLRSKGYALPWMGLSVEEMVQAGWIKLEEVSNDNS